MSSVCLSRACNGTIGHTKSLTRKPYYVQVVTGGLKAAGAVIKIQNSILTAPNIGLLEHSQVSDIYSWSEELQQHQVISWKLIINKASYI